MIELEAGETKYFSITVRNDSKLTIEGAFSATVQFGVRTFIADRMGNIVIDLVADPMNMMGTTAIFSVTNTGEEATTYGAKVAALVPGTTMDDPIVLEEGVTTDATVVVDGMGCSFLVFTATKSGTITMTATDANVSFSITNQTTGVTEDNGVATVTVTEGDQLFIAAGYEEMIMSDVTFGVTLTYAE